MKYENVFSVMEEVYHKEWERIDLVIFLNGIALFAIELKCNLSGQNYKDAISQFMFEKEQKKRLFEFKRGVFVSFAKDLEEVWMTTHLCRRDMEFKPVIGFYLATQPFVRLFYKKPIITYKI